MKPPRPLLAFPLLALVAFSGASCAPTASDSGDRGDTGTTHVPDLPVSECGLDAYDWLPTGTMGTVVEYESMDGYSLTAESLDALLEMAGTTAFSPLPYGIDTWRVRYLTQDRGQEVEATAVITLPDFNDSSEGSSVPVVLFTHGTTGFTDACAPSAGDLGTLSVPFVMAASGYAVVVPDYLGMNGFGDPAEFLHPYLVPEATAVASLDALRALRAFGGERSLPAEPDFDQVVLWGGSEGGFAALWIERYAPGYAPEFGLRANVALVPPTDVTGLAVHGVTEPGPTTAGMAAALVAMNDWHGGGGSLESVFTNEDPTWVADSLPEEMASSCTDFPSVEDAETVEEIFLSSFVETVQAEDWRGVDPFGCYLEEATLNRSPIPVEDPLPTLVVLSEDDDLVISEIIRDDLGVLCDQGLEIQHMECADMDHADGAVYSLPYQFEWVEERLAGTPLPEEDTCVITDPVDCEAFLEESR